MARLQATRNTKQSRHAVIANSAAVGVVRIMPRVLSDSISPHPHPTDKCLTAACIKRQNLATTISVFLCRRNDTVWSPFNSSPTFSPYLYNGVWSELTCSTSLSHSRLACSRLSAHIQPSVINPRRQTRPIHGHELS